MKPISFVGYGDIGSQTGQALTELASGLDSRDLLDQVYCRGVDGPNKLPKDVVITPIPFGEKIPQVMTGINQYMADDFNNRYYSEQLFDFFTSKSISDTGIHLHHTPGYIRTLRKGNQGGNRTIVKVAAEYAPSCFQRIKDEFKDFGYTLPESVIQDKRAEVQETTLQESDSILAISSFVQDSLTDAGFPDEKISVTPLGVNSNNYPVASKQKEQSPFTVLYVGSITINKGVHYLLKAWEANGWGNDSQVRLFLCGNISSTMQNILSEYNFNNVQTPGYVNPREYYQKASVFAFPSLSDGWAKAPVEAMASGLPVIVTDNTGMKDIVVDGTEGFIIPIGEADILADRLKYLRENPDVRQDMQEQSLQTAQKQTWNKHVKSVVEALNLDIG